MKNEWKKSNCDNNNDNGDYDDNEDCNNVDDDN